VLLIFPISRVSEEELCNAFIKHKMAKRIQRTFLECYYDPTFEICRKRLTKEFNELNEEMNE
jgi:hypothetical protein